MYGPLKRLENLEDLDRQEVFSGEYGDSAAEKHPNGMDEEVRHVEKNYQVND